MKYAQIEIRQGDLWSGRLLATLSYFLSWVARYNWDLVFVSCLPKGRCSKQNEIGARSQITAKETVAHVGDSESYQAKPAWNERFKKRNLRLLTAVDSNGNSKGFFSNCFWEYTKSALQF